MCRPAAEHRPNGPASSACQAGLFPRSLFPGNDLQSFVTSPGEGEGQPRNGLSSAFQPQVTRVLAGRAPDSARASLPGILQCLQRPGFTKPRQAGPAQFPDDVPRKPAPHPATAAVAEVRGGLAPTAYPGHTINPSAR